MLLDHLLRFKLQKKKIKKNLKNLAVQIKKKKIKVINKDRLLIIILFKLCLELHWLYYLVNIRNFLSTLAILFLYVTDDGLIQKKAKCEGDKSEKKEKF